MPRQGDTQADPQVDTYAMQLGRWLSTTLDSRGMKPIDLWRLMQQNPPRNGRVPSRAPVFSWAAGVTSATADNVIYIARLLDADPVEPLELAGHGEVAELFKSNAPAPGRTAGELMAAESDDELIARLRSSKNPEMREIACTFERDLARARRMAMLEMAEVLRRSGESAASLETRGIDRRAP